MVSQNDGWHTAFVMSIHKDKLFFVVIQEGISAIMRKTPGIKLGDFFSVKYAYNEQANASNRAQHIITQYSPIKPLGPVRIEEDERGYSHVLIRTKAPVRDTVLLSDKTHALRLYNDDFGFFIDQRKLVTFKNKLVDFEFKCRASDHDQYRSIFVPVKVIGYYELPIEDEPRSQDHGNRYFEQRRISTDQEHSCQRILGFVCSQIQRNGVLYLWARNLDHDAVLEQRFCPRDREICSRWVEAYVDLYNNRVVDMVRIIDDLYETRLERGVPEIRVTVHFSRFHQDGNYSLYEAADFGLICDTDKVIKKIVVNKEYNVWIVRQKTDIPRCRWKISLFQQHYETEWDRMPRNSDRPDSRSSNNLPQSSNSEFVERNINNDYYEVHGHRRSFFDSQRTRDADEVSRAPTTDSEDEEADLPTIPRDESPRNPNHIPSNSDDVAPARRRQRAPTTDSSDESIASTFERNGTMNGHRSNEVHQNGHRENQRSGPQLSRSIRTGLETPSRSERNSLNSSYGTPMMDFPQNEPSSSSAPPKPHQRLEELIASKDYKIDKITALVKFFTSHETVFNAMNAVDPVKCQELMQALLK
ncbi:unnamed protein product [Caenorhabditis brenneri]